MTTYFSERRGIRKGYGLPELRVMTRDLYNETRENGALTEWLGDWCIDEGRIPGTAGIEPGRDVVLEVGRTDIWPPEPVDRQWSEDAVFDFLQFIGSKVSSAVEGSGTYHEWNNCGWHGQSFRPEPARSGFVSRVNRILGRYNNGWEMTPNLEIVERAPDGLDDLLGAELPKATDEDVVARVQAAIDKYRRRTSSRDDRRDAVRDLGDVLEYLRGSAKKHLGKDESDLFNILNNFNIRHNDPSQKKGYDPIWLAGLFYHYLAMIHVLAQLIVRDGAE